MAAKTMAATKKIKFTKTALEAIPDALPGKRINVYDATTRGLMLRTTDRGVKSFVFCRKIQGRAERIFIGRFPDVSVEQARGKAAEHAGAIFKGENPADKRRLDRAEMTLQEFFDEFIKRHSKPRKRTWQEDKSKFDQYLASSEDGINLADRKLSAIRRSDIATLHVKIGQSHPTTANRVLALASSIFGRATEWGIWEGANPCRGIRRFPEKSRERFLQPDELPRFFKALAAEKNETMRDFFFMALLTGARRSNVLEMRWEDITLSDERNEWRIPRTKSGDAHSVPLTEEAVNILEARLKTAKGDAKFVFAGDGESGRLNEPRRAWKRILKAAKIKDLRIHDLRRTLGSIMVATGASLAVIAKTLHHADISTTQIYARLGLDPVREAMARATSAMFVTGGIKPKGKIIEMKRRKAGR